MMRPLERTLDPGAFAEARANALFHLESLVARDDGDVAKALETFGPADAAGRAMLDEWCRGRSAVGFARGSSAAAWWSFAFFGLAFGLMALATEAVALWPGAGSPAMSGAARVASVAAPVVAGALTGRLVPTGDLRALALALAVLLGYALLLGLLMRPFFEPTLFPGTLLAWAPLGAAATAASAWLRRHGRSRRGGPKGVRA